MFCLHSSHFGPIVKKNPIKCVCKIRILITAATSCAHRHKPAEKAPTRLKVDTEDPESSSTQHGAGVRQHLETVLVVVCTAVQQGRTGCMAGTFLQYVSTFSPARLALQNTKTSQRFALIGVCIGRLIAYIAIKICFI